MSATASTMQALVLHGPGDLRLDEVPKPTAFPGSVVVQVIAAPLWDYVADVIGGSLNFPHAYPLVFGTCCVGRIEEVGPDVGALEPGMLVFCDHIIYLRDAPECRFVLGYHGGHLAKERKLSSGQWKNGCFAKYATFPVENVHVIDEDRITAQGLAPARLAEISSVMSAVGAANSIGVRPGETVIVMPATGFFSSSAVVAALGLGADVVAVSRSRETLDAMIAGFGEDGKRISPVVITGDVEKDAAALRAATPGGKGADAYIDFSSPAAAEGTHVRAGLLALKRHGRCCFAGVVQGNLQLPYTTIRLNGLTIQGSFAQNRADVEVTIRLIESGRLKPRKEIAGKFALDDYEKAIKLAKENRGWENIVLITP